jgi:hypothetical protein
VEGSKGKKGELASFFERIDNGDFHKPENKNDFLSQLEDINTKIPLYQLKEIAAYFSKNSNPDGHSILEPIIENRFSQLNEVVLSVLPDFPVINQESYNQWYKRLAGFYPILVNKADVNHLASMAKEIPVNSPEFGIILELLNSRLPALCKRRLPVLARDEIRMEKAVNAVQEDIQKVLWHYDTLQPIEPYLARCITNKFNKIISDEIAEDKVKEYSDDQQLLKIFITLSLYIFQKLDSKPHHKLIFWHENTDYVKVKSRIFKQNPGLEALRQSDFTGVIDHDTFVQEKGQHNLEKLWESAMEKIIDDHLELSKNPYYFEEKQDEWIKDQFTGFTDVLGDLFSKVYPEREYKLIRKEKPGGKVGQMLLLDFLKDKDGVLPDPENIRTKISNWNTRIKVKLKKELHPSGRRRDKQTIS